MPLIKRGPTDLGKRALNTGVRIAIHVMPGQNIKTAANRRVTAAGIELLSGTVATPVVSSRNTRVKRTFATRRVSAVPRRRKKKKTRELDVFDDGFSS